MKTTISKYSVISLIIFIELLLDTDFLYLLNIRHFWAVVFTVFAMIFYYITFHKEHSIISRKSKNLNTLLLIYYLCYMVLFTYSLIVYRNQSLYETIVGENESYSLCFVILVFPILCKIYHDKGPNELLKQLNMFAVLVCCLEILQVIVYQITGSIFLSQYFGDRTIGFRTYGLRIIMHWTGNIMSIYNFYMFYNLRPLKNGKSYLKYLFLFGIMIFDQIAISQTRQNLLIIAACILFLIMFEKSKKYGGLKKGFVLTAVFVGVILSGIIDTFIQSFSLTGDLGVSTAGRLYAYNYYWNYFLEHPLFGFAFANKDINSSIVSGTGIAFVDDVGIVGNLAKLGLFLIPMYIIPFFRCISIIISSGNKVKIPNIELYWSFLIYIILGSATQLLLDQERILFLPILLAMCEYINIATRSKREIKFLK